MLTVGDALTRIALQKGRKSALIFGRDEVSYEQLNRRSNQIAWTLHAQGLQAGDRVALLFPNGPDIVESYFGVAKAGMLAVPLNTRWTISEIEYALRDADVSVVLADPAFEPLLRQLSSPDFLVYFTDADGIWQEWIRRAQVIEPDFHVVHDTEPWLIIYTSGTTGKPKGAMRSHISTLMVALTLVTELGITSDQVGFAILPLFHVNSMLFVILSVVIGSTCVIYAKHAIHPRDIIEQMNQHKIHYSMMVPSLLAILADAVETGKISPDSLQVILSSSAPLTTTLRDRLVRGFPKSRFYDVYGSTEYGAATLLRIDSDGPSGSVGYPLMGLDLLLLDEERRPVAQGVIGEVFVRGLSVISGYWRNAVADALNFTADRYLTVGDMGYVDTKGYLYLVDRKQDMIVVAGENVYPSEVEEVLMRHPSVALTTVFGIADALRGERVVALAVVKDGLTVSVEELTLLCRDYLADYKQPYRIAIVSDLPIGPAGKVVRRQARMLWLEK